MTGTGGPLRLDALCVAGRDGVAARQAGLPIGVRQVHRAVLRAFLDAGHAPHADDLPRPVGIDRNEAWALLDRRDLVHLDPAGRVVVAYPFSGRRTVHSVDPTADPRRDYGLSCRFYPGPDGPRGTPPDEWVLAALRPPRVGEPDR